MPNIFKTLKKNRILVTVIVTVIVLFALVTGLYISGVNSFIYTTTTTSLEEISINEDLVINRYLEGNLNTLTIFASSFSDPKRCPATLDDAQYQLYSVRSSQDIFSAFYLVDEDGTMYTDIFIKTSEPALFKLFVEESADGIFCTRLDQTGLYSESKTTEFIYGIPLDIEIEGHHIIGLIGKTKIANLDGKLSDVNFNGEGHTTLVDADGFLLINKDAAAHSQNYRENLFDIIATRATYTQMPSYEVYDHMRNRESFVFRWTLDGEEKITCCHPMEINDWYLLVTIPETVFTDTVVPFTVASIIVLAGVAVLFILLAVFLVKSASRTVEARTDAKNKAGFLANMSHEIRTPLNGIIGISHLMKSHVNEPEKITGYLEKLDNASHYLLNLINDILDVSKLQAGKMELHLDVAKLDTLCDAAYSMNVAKITEKNIEYTVNRAIKHNMVVIDATRLQQVINNIISNAYKFTPEGGKITMDVTQKDEANNMVTTCFKIADTGCGMSPEFKEKIFEEFSQDRNANEASQKGTGLGMAISRQTMHLMGGELEVESELGVGSVFTIVLPAQIASPDDYKAAETKTPAETERRTAKILVAEDNELNAEIVCEMLEDEGISNDLAINGEEALKLFSDSKPGEYSVILMDMQMPKMNGIDAAKAIRALDRPDAKTVRIIACTANTFQEDRDAARNAGMDEFLPKPINIGDLLEKIHR